MRVVLFYLFLLLSFPAFGQRNVLFKNIFETNNGLGSNSINCFAQDDFGIMWIGTENGLQRYDGHQFSIPKIIASSLEHTPIPDLLFDSSGSLWIATWGKGVYKYNHRLASFEHYTYNSNGNSELSSNNIYDLEKDSNGNIWIGTDRGITKYTRNNQSFKVFKNEPENLNSLGNNIVRSIFKSSDGTIWIGTFGNGLQRFNEATASFITIKGHAKASKLSIYDIEEISPNHLVVGTRENGLVHIYIDGDKQSSQSHMVTNEWVPEVGLARRVIKDSDGNLWVGTDGNGIYQIKNIKSTGYKVEHYQQNDGISGNSIYGLFESKDKNIWAGTIYHGLTIIDRRLNDIKVFSGSVANSKPSNVLSVWKEKDRMLVGTDGNGLIYFDLQHSTKKYFNTTSKFPFPAKSIQQIKKKNDSIFWIGSYDKGLYLLNINTGKHREMMLEASNEGDPDYFAVYDLHELENGNLLIATWNKGMSLYNIKDRSLQTFTRDDQDPFSISSNNATKIIEVNKDKFIIATADGGFNVFDLKSKSFKRIWKEEHIVAIRKSFDHKIWVATTSGKLMKFDTSTNTFKDFKELAFLEGKYIYGIIEDNDKALWIVTKNNIYKFNEREGKLDSFSQFNITYNESVSTKDLETGEVLFGNNENVIVFDPSTVKNKEATVKPRIVNFKLFNKEIPFKEKESPIHQPIEYEDAISLHYNQSVFTFDFATSQYIDPEQYEFAIKMVNFDEDWRYIGTQTSTTYTTLRPGDYEFRVKTRKKDLPWPDQFTSISLTVRKPWWLTNLAIALYVVLGATLLLLFRKYITFVERLKSNIAVEKITREKEAETHQIKELFFTNVSHEIRTPVTLMLGAINNMFQKGIIVKGQERQALVIQKKGTQLLNLVNELLDFRKLETGNLPLQLSIDDIVVFSKEIFLSFSDQAYDHRIDYQFICDEETSIHTAFDKRQMEKVLHNLLMNAFKFTPDDGKIILKITKESQQVHLSVADSGSGIPEDQLLKVFKRFHQSPLSEPLAKEKGFGIGLSITKDIVELHNGQIQVHNNSCKGVTFLVSLPLNAQMDSADIKIKPANEVVPEQLVENLAKLEIGKAKNIFSILLVEDNPELLQYLVTLLEGEFEIATASNGKEGLKKALQYIPDLIISDIMMPEMDGMTMTQKLKTDMRTSHIPIILLTAMTAMTYQKTGYSTGADDYITKPFNESLLRSRIRNLVRIREQLREKFTTDAIVQPKELALSNPDHEFLDRLMSILEENIDEKDLNIQLITTHLGMSHSVVYKKVKALTGLSVVEFIREFRLKRSAQLLRTGQFNISQVSYQVGFSDRKYFSQIFKKKYGVNPSEYNKK